MNFSQVSRLCDPPLHHKFCAVNQYSRPNGVSTHGLMLAVALVLLLMSTIGASAAGKVALVMVAEDYQKLQKSSVGLKRGSEIADALAARGFDVTLSTNPSNAAARAKLRDLSDKIAGADIALAVLIGHGIAWEGQSFYLLANTEVDRATDLLSRALSVGSIAQVVGRAKAGGVLFFMTVPHFDNPISGLDSRPQLTSELGKNVFVVFSSSSRVPVSRVDAASEQAAEALANILKTQNPSLSEAIKAASNGNTGTVIGTATDINLAAPPTVATADPTALIIPQSPTKTASGAEAEDRLKAERQARELAEKQILAEQTKVEQARAEVQKAQADALKAQAEAKKAQSEAERAQAEAERAKLEAKRVETQAQTAMVNTQPPASVKPPIDEAQLGQKQRQKIQEKLRAMSLYTGPIDAIMGPLTREAIMGFQKSRGAAVTGYLTADQFDALLPKNEQ